jgi:hypothetical protein
MNADTRHAGEPGTDADAIDWRAVRRALGE